MYPVIHSHKLEDSASLDIKSPNRASQLWDYGVWSWYNNSVEKTFSVVGSWLFIDICSLVNTLWFFSPISYCFRRRACLFLPKSFS